jgi:hypothetical protein
VQLTAILATLTRSAVALNDVRAIFSPFMLPLNDSISAIVIQIVSNHLLIVAPEGRDDRGPLGPGSRSRKLTGGPRVVKFDRGLSASQEWGFAQ